MRCDQLSKENAIERACGAQEDGGYGVRDTRSRRLLAWSMKYYAPVTSAMASPS
jgi:hypothetical protein